MIGRAAGLELALAAVSFVGLIAAGCVVQKGDTPGGAESEPTRATPEDRRDGESDNPADKAEREHAYKVFENQETWAEASDYCTAQGGHLATIESPEENDLVYSRLAALGYESAYFGLHNDGGQGWKWVTSESTEFMNWHEGEPNNEGGRESYGMYYWKFDDGTWNDGDFRLDGTVNGGRAFICEWDSGPDDNSPSVAAAFVEDFISGLPPEGVDTDHAYGMQCKDLANAYISSLGADPPRGNAIALKAWQLPEEWTRDGTPRVGDIFVKSYILGGVDYGHTGLVTNVNADGTFDTIEQNNGPNGESSLSEGYPPTRHHGYEPKGHSFIHPEF